MSPTAVVEPWEHSWPNGQTLIDAQRELLADQRPYRKRPGKVRAPRRNKARGPDWQPLELTEELLERVVRARAGREQPPIAEDPEGPFKEYNAAVSSLPWSNAQLELLSHLMSDEDYYRQHPIRALWRTLRHAPPGTYRQTWQEVRTGTIRFGFAR